MSDSNVSRRYFFFGSLLAAAVPAGGFGSVASLRAAGYKPFYNKLNFAGIGIGAQGGSDLGQAAQSENVIAVCDVDWERGAPGLQRYEKAGKYKDFRVMLDKEKTIEAVTIGIPDHMHAQVALACMQRGIHTYVEKPLTRTPWDARLLADAAVKYKVATQMGNQGYSHECNRVAAEILWSGEIGEVREVHASTNAPSWPQGLQQQPKEASIPETLDWDLWLGGASMRAYSPEYLPFNWRGFPDFGTGPIGDWGVHVLGPANLGLELGAPTSVECIRAENESKWSFAERMVTRFDFPARGEMPPVSIFWYDNSANADPANLYHPPGMENETILPPSNNLADKGRPGVGGGGRGGVGAGGGRGAGRGVPGEAGPGFGPGGPGAAAGAAPAGRGGAGAGRGGPGAAGGRGGGPRLGVLTGHGAVFVGSKGLMATSQRGEGVWLLPAERWAAYTLPPQLLSRSPGHMRDFLRACKGGEPACSHFGIAGPYVEWLTLGSIAQQFPKQKLLWDSKNQRITNHAAANELVKPKFRKGWELKL